MLHMVFQPIAALAQAIPGPSGNVDWVYQFTNNLTNLTTQNGGALTHIGLVELSFVALCMLITMVIRWNTASMTFSLNHHPLQAGELVQFLIRLVICCLLESYWVNPLPGTSFGFNHLFSYLAQAIVQALDQNSLSTLQQLLQDAGQGTAAPSLLAPLQIVCYVLVQILLGFASAVLFLINVSSFILYGVTALFGPIFIPLYLTNTFRGKFLHFVDTLLSFAMIRAVASAFIFVWAGFLNGFIQQTFNNDYSLEKWLANLIPCAAVFIAFDLNLLFIPTITQAIFGGSAGLASRAEQTATQLLKVAGV